MRSSASLRASPAGSLRSSPRASLRASPSASLRVSHSRRSNYESPLAKKSTYSRSRKNEIRKMDAYDEAELVDMFKKQIDIEREIELAK